MKKEKCAVCGGVSEKIFSSKIMEKYDISYFYCSRCCFLQTERPYWLDEAYKSPINEADTGLIARNLQNASLTAPLLYHYFGTPKLKRPFFLDYAGGYGVFVRLMRDAGFDFYWNDPYTNNIFAKGFDYAPHADDLKISALTAFEVFEHFSDPLIEIEKMLNISRNIIFSTFLIPASFPPQPSHWWYYGLDHGQHISFYSKKTLEFIASRYGLFFHSYNSCFHIFTEFKISSAVFYCLCRFNKYYNSLVINRRLKSLITSDALKLIQKKGGKFDE